MIACEHSELSAVAPRAQNDSAIRAAPVSPPSLAVAARPDAVDTHAPTVELAAGREITIATGMLRAGSPTGTPYRNPAAEADEVPVEVASFAIDALPYPNDPARPFRSAINRVEAQKLCATEGKRLCHELEWERACKGDVNASYPHFREGFEPAKCASDPRQCASPFGVLSLGATAREWTTSLVGAGLGDSLRTAVVRGAPRDAALPAHRCAARDAVTPDSKSDSLGFRCCRGATPTLAYPTEPVHEAFREATIPHAKLAGVLATIEGLSGKLEGFRPFSEREIGESLQKAGSSRTRVAPWVASAVSLSWSPVHGEDVLVVAGDTPKGALLVVAHRLADEKLKLIGTFETANEHTAIIVAYKADAPREVLFSSCWGCGGEGGAIVFGEDARIQISPR